MRSKLPVAATILVGLLASAHSAPLTADPMLGDARLARPVTLQEPLAAISELIGKLQAQTGVSMSVKPPLSQQTACLFVTDCPARQALSELASAMGYTWTKDADRSGSPAYRLFESQAAADRSRAAAAEFRKGIGTELETQITLLGEATARPARTPAEAEAEEAELKQAVEALPVGAERLQAERKLQVASMQRGAMLLPVFLAGWRALSPELRARVLSGERVVMMAGGRPPAVAMPPAVSDQFRRLREERARRLRVPQPPRYSDHEYIEFRSYVLSGLLTLCFRGRNLADSPSPMSITLPSYRLTPSRQLFAPPNADERPGELTADRTSDLDRPVHFVWPAVGRKPEDSLTYTKAALVPAVLRRLCASEPSLKIAGDTGYRALRWTLSRALGTEGQVLNGDSPQQMLSHLGSEYGRLGKLPLRTLLDEVAQRGNTDIHVTAGGWIRLRSTLYFQDRDSSPSAAAVERLFRDVAGGSTYTPERAMRAAGELTRAQAATLASETLGFLQPPLKWMELRDTHPAWRLTSALTPDHQQTALKGETLSAARLSLGERRALREMLAEVSDSPGGSALDLDLDQSDLPRLQIQLREDSRGTAAMEIRHADAPSVPLYRCPLGSAWARQGG